MKALNLITALKGYKNGWVAIDKKSVKVIAHAKDFASINQKVKKTKKNLFLMPASDNYLGFIT